MAIEMLSAAEHGECSELRRAAERIGEWVHDAEGDDFEFMLQALQIEVRAEKGRGELSGVIPEYASPCNHPYVRSMVTNFRGIIGDSTELESKQLDMGAPDDIRKV